MISIALIFRQSFLLYHHAEEGKLKNKEEAEPNLPLSVIDIVADKSCSCGKPKFN